MRAGIVLLVELTLLIFNVIIENKKGVYNEKDTVTFIGYYDWA